MRKIGRYFVFGSLLLLCGCAHYQYRLVEPADSAQTIDQKTSTVKIDPLEYRFARPDDHIAMQIVNPTDDPVTLLGPKSYVVDPAGETRAVRGGIIAPHSYIGMTLPPTVRIYTSGYYGAWGMGFGFYDPLYYGPRVGHPFLYPYGFYDPFLYDPVYSYQVLTPYDWEWKLGDVRLKLEYDRAGKNFVHNLVFTKQKVERH